MFPHELSVPADLRPPRSLFANHGAVPGGWFERFAHANGLAVPGVVYIPIYWATLGVPNWPKAIEWLSQAVEPGVKYYTLSMIGFQHLGEARRAPWTKRITFIDTAAGDVVIPLVHEALLNRSPELRAKKHLASFVGTINQYTDYRGVRSRSINKLPDGSVVKVNTGHATKIPLPFEEYFQILQESEYVLAPRGAGPTSYRLFEAFAAGSVPIYVWKDHRVLPFAHCNDIDWDGMAIVAEDEWNGELQPRSVKAGAEYFKRYCQPKELVHRIKEELIRIAEQQ